MCYSEMGKNVGVRSLPCLFALTKGIDSALLLLAIFLYDILLSSLS